YGGNNYFQCKANRYFSMLCIALSVDPASTNSKTPTVPGWGFFLPDRADSLVVLGFRRTLAVADRIPLVPSLLPEMIDHLGGGLI
ncbi:MAG: hypothetical protein R3F04_09380, partial [Lysobacteraceae bacterium]